MISLKIRKRPVMLFVALVSAAFTCFFISCSGDSEEKIRKKLDVICKDDLKAITDSIATENLIQKPYYKLVFYKQYDEGKYSRKAITEFYFLKNVTVKVVRKYRYHASIQMWDRYSNEYVFIHDTSSTVPDK